VYFVYDLHINSNNCVNSVLVQPVLTLSVVLSQQTGAHKLSPAFIHILHYPRHQQLRCVTQLTSQSTCHRHCRCHSLLNTPQWLKTMTTR